MPIVEKSIYLNYSVSNCDIFLTNKFEPNLQLTLINYPRFRLGIEKMKAEIPKLTEAMIINFSQNRVVIEFIDETVMLEQPATVAPRVNSFQE